MRMISNVCIALLVLVSGGCAQVSLKDIEPMNLFRSKSEQTLASGIRQYEDGQYAESQASLESALDMGLEKSADQVSAHKYLAFIYCSSKRQAACRDEFRKVLTIDPNFELTPAEAGHPLWGSVFRSLKRNQK